MKSRFGAVICSALLLATWSSARAQGTDQNAHKKYPWQWKDTNCTEHLDFCWYGADSVSDPEVIAYGDRWVSQDKEESPFEWITEVRCVQQLRTCILARNQKLFTDRTQTNIDLFTIKEWTDNEIRAVEESNYPSGNECEIDTLLLNRAGASVSMLSVPGPAGASKPCIDLMKPKTVIYKMEFRKY